jgi:hypothetical protein
VPLDYLTPRDVIKACGRYGVTTLAAVPPLWVQLVEQEWPTDAVDGDAPPHQQRRGADGRAGGQAAARFPQARLFPMYGLTERFRSTYLDPALVDSHPDLDGQGDPVAEILVIGDDGDVTAPRRGGRSWSTAGRW